MIRLMFASRLKVHAGQLWREISRMPGVNREISPYLIMTYPYRFREFSLDNAPTDRTLFRSILLAGGVIPFDLHFLRLHKVLPGEGFCEQSTSLFNRRWQHTRWIVNVGPSVTEIHDRLEINPRLHFAESLIKPIVRILFQHRHDVLRHQYSGTSCPTDVEIPPLLL